MRQNQKRLGVDSLFIRRAHHKMDINPLYEKIVTKCIQINLIHSEIGSYLSESREVFSFSIFSSQSLFEAFIIPFLNDYLKKNGGITINLGECNDLSYTSPSPTHVSMVTHVTNDKDFYEYFPFHDFTQKLWASKSYIKELGPFDSIHDLNEKSILFQKGRLFEKDQPKTQELVGFRGIFNALLDKRIDLKMLNITGVRTIDAMCEAGCAIMVASEETTNLNHLKVENVLENVTGDTVPVYIKVQKNILSKSDHLKSLIDWMFKCRDIQLTKIGFKVVYPHTTLLREPSNVT
jgi:hypothetical protein